MRHMRFAHLLNMLKPLSTQMSQGWQIQFQPGVDLVWFVLFNDIWSQ